MGLLAQNLDRDSCWKQLQFQFAYRPHFVTKKFKYLSTLSTYCWNYTGITFRDIVSQPVFNITHAISTKQQSSRHSTNISEMFLENNSFPNRRNGARLTHHN